MSATTLLPSERRIVSVITFFPHSFSFFFSNRIFVWLSFARAKKWTVANPNCGHCPKREKITLPLARLFNREDSENDPKNVYM